MNKVSIVIPCFNAGGYLAEAIQSALAQTAAEVEVIVVDDGSDDPDTLRFLDGPIGSRVRIFRQDNAGPAAARNRAIEEATGDYILPLDADDLIEPNYAAKAAAVLDARPEVGIVYCRAMKFGEQQDPWDLPEYSADGLAIGNVIFVSAMFRKADWMEVGGFDETLRHGMEDYDFWIKLVHAGRSVVQLDEVLFHCRVREQSRTSEFERDREQVVATYAEIFRANRDFYAKHAESLFRHRFSALAESMALRDRLERESIAAKAQLAALASAKAEADRYNDSLLAESMALRDRLERESIDAMAELAALASAKAEADRYNDSLLSELETLRKARMLAERHNAKLVSELQDLHGQYAKMQRRFRWLKPLWPRHDKDPQEPK